MLASTATVWSRNIGARGTRAEAMLRSRCARIQRVSDLMLSPPVPFIFRPGASLARQNVETRIPVQPCQGLQGAVGLVFPKWSSSLVQMGIKLVTLGPEGTCHERAARNYMAFQGIEDYEVAFIGDFLDGLEQIR